ncbi:uncharacterized protein I206_106638 [Kwoniella pini CBS 10737]|uniref:Uncharacterized protein n=1 Tax=Kwoniella pini CBS 10737 TaxID=1296096 RepID=A0A1B9HTL9_9TREE|nr:uncharacterized protein I206_07471 [Kwoniella pini CBS 10737]OCF46618.1 hypothetical protein I206_07471 [Kwoniella pini CBS 10737]
MSYSPPLSLLYLAPPLHPVDLRPVSAISAASGTTLPTSVFPPPSAYYHRSRSLKLLQTTRTVLPFPHNLSRHSGAAEAEVAECFQDLLASSQSNMATTPQQPPKKPGFFRRMSISSSQSSKASVHASNNNNNGLGNNNKSYGRSVSGPLAGRETIAGPSYDALPVGGATNTFKSKEKPNNPGMKYQQHVSISHLGESIATRPAVSTLNAGSFGSSTAPRPPTSLATPPRSRQPIRPALASPPTPPSRRMSSSTPYQAIEPKTLPFIPQTTSNAMKGDVFQAKGNGSGPSKTASRSDSKRPDMSVHPPTHIDPISLGLIDSPREAQHREVESLRTNGPARPIPTPLKIPGDERQVNSSGSYGSISQREKTARYSRFDDAESSKPVGLPAGAQEPVYVQPNRIDPRPMVSARRSTSSSRRTPIAKIETRVMSPGSQPVVKGPDTTSPPMSARPPIIQQNKSQTSKIEVAKTKEQLSEAGAYAKAIAATINHHEGPKSSGESAPYLPAKSPAARPLPAPPAANGVSRSTSKANVVVIASSPKSHKSITRQENLESKVEVNRFAKEAQVKPSATTSPVKALTPPIHNRRSVQPLNFDFPRSPTLPPLVDPRTSNIVKADPVTQWARESDPPRSPGSPTPLATSQLPPRQSSASNSRRAVSSPLVSPNIGSDVHMSARPQLMSPDIQASTTSEVKHRDRPRATITFLLLHNRIQAALLSHLSINSFLSLTGASDTIRKRFTGEAIGRWVLKEWGIQVDREKGRSWPNLTVWEGFLESLLHDPITYSTYPPQWHNLLQHLCLSHSLIVLHLRQLPSSAFPNPPPSPFEDDFVSSVPHLPFSASMNSFGSQRPRSRLGSAAGSDAGSLTPATKMPRQERLVEIVMPEPLSSVEQQEQPSTPFPEVQKARRRGSIGSIASAASLSFGRRRSASISTDARIEMAPVTSAAPMQSGKAALPPVSYPSAKRYGFKRHGEPTRSRQSSESSRPGSIFSVQSTPSFSGHQRASSGYNMRPSFAVDRNAPPVPGFPAGLPMPPPIGGGYRSSFASSDARSSRPSENGGVSPRSGLTFSRRDLSTPPPIRPEPVFDRPIPYTVGRAPILRVFVPLSDSVQRWPSAEGAAIAVKELEKCGAMRRMKLGDLVVNTAIRQPKTTEHVLVFVPFVRHLLIPLDYSFSPTGHLPSYVNGFEIPPSFYYPFLPTPQILYLDLAPFARQALQSIRLAYDRRDVTTASGARLSAKRYLHVAGFEIGPEDRVAPEWHGMVSLETEGTAEAKHDLEKRLIGFGGSRPLVGPWELVREKSMIGTIWLRLVKQE